MEENPLARQVADELKMLITASVESIKEENYGEARVYLDQAFALTELLEYHDGSVMVLHNLANLHALTGDNIAALSTAAIAIEKAKLTGGDCADCERLLRGLFIAVQREGVGHVRDREYARALACFEAAFPFAPEDGKNALERQIALLRRAADGR